jgi:DNA-binding PadR family transcriptional regulator
MSELGRRAKVYRLTTKGTQRLRAETAQWNSFQAAVSKILLGSAPVPSSA